MRSFLINCIAQTGGFDWRGNGRSVCFCFVSCFDLFCRSISIMFCFVTALMLFWAVNLPPSSACYYHSPTFSGAQTGWRPGTRRRSHSAHFHVEKPSLVNSDSYVSIVTTVWLARKVFSCGLSISWAQGHAFTVEEIAYNGLQPPDFKKKKIESRRI